MKPAIPGWLRKLETAALISIPVVAIFVSYAMVAASRQLWPLKPPVPGDQMPDSSFVGIIATVVLVALVIHGPWAYLMRRSSVALRWRMPLSVTPAVVLVALALSVVVGVGAAALDDYSGGFAFPLLVTVFVPFAWLACGLWLLVIALLPKKKIADE